MARTPVKCPISPVLARLANESADHARQYPHSVRTLQHDVRIRGRAQRFSRLEADEQAATPPGNAGRHGLRQRLFKVTVAWRGDDYRITLDKRCRGRWSIAECSWPPRTSSPLIHPDRKPRAGLHLGGSALAWTAATAIADDADAHCYRLSSARSGSSQFVFSRCARSCNSCAVSRG